MMEYDKWPVVYEDSELKVKRNPEDPEEYGVFADKLKESLLYLPRGTLENIARVDRLRGKRMMDNLSPYYLTELIQYTGLNSDSVIAAITKAYIIEEKAYNEFLKEKL